MLVCQGHVNDEDVSACYDERSLLFARELATMKAHTPSPAGFPAARRPVFVSVRARN